MSPASLTRNLLESPWRFFFPLGVFGLLMGVACWWTDFPAPAVMWHPELMISGFLLPIGTGFLLYTLPRFFSARRASAWEAWSLLLAEASLASAILCVLPLAVAILKTAALLILAFFAIIRFPRTRLAPVFAVFVVAGILLGTAGALASVIAVAPQEWTAPFRDSAAVLHRNTFYHGFFWFLFLGMGTRLFPMLTLSVRLPTDTRWKKALAYSRVAWYSAAGALVISFVFAHGPWHVGMLWLRAVTVLYVAWQGWLLFRPPTRHGVVPAFVKVANVAVVAGHFLVAAFPSYEPALRHLPLAGGLALGTLLVVTRVSLAHEGAQLIHETNSPSLAVAFSAMFAGAIVRTLALFPESYLIQISVASGLWLAGVLVWVSALVVYLRRDRASARAAPS